MSFVEYPADGDGATDLIPDSTSWSEVEILSLIVCSCIPCLRNLVGKWPRLKTVFGLSETSMSYRPHNEPEQLLRPPLVVRNLIRTGLTPSAFSSAGMTPATTGTAKNSTRDASPRSASNSARQALAQGRSFVDLGRRPSLVDCFPRQLPNKPNGGSNTALADNLLRRSLTGQDAAMERRPPPAATSGTSSLGASHATSRRRSDALGEVPEGEKEAPSASEPTDQVELINDQIEDAHGPLPERRDFAASVAGVVEVGTHVRM